MPKDGQALPLTRRRGAFLAIAPALAWSSIASAAGQATNVRIAEIAMNRQQGNFVFVRMEQAPSGMPMCSNNGYWHFTLSLDDATGKNLYAVLLMAHATNKNVTIQGTNGCAERGDIESIQVIFSAT